MKDNNSKEQVLTIAIKCGGVTEIALGANTLLDKAHIISLFTRRAKDTRKTKNKKSIVNDTVFDSAFLTMQTIDSKVVVGDLPLEAIELENTLKSQKLGYEINMCNIDLSNSKISIQTDENNIVPDEHFELTFKYIPYGKY